MPVGKGQSQGRLRSAAALARRKLTFWEATSVGLGNIVGAGIFVMVGSAISEAGPGALLAFVVTAGLAITVGLNSAELSSKFPSIEGGVYSFARVTLGDTTGFLVGWLRLVSYAVSGGAVALGFSAYLIQFGFPQYTYYPLAGALIVALSWVEVRGIKIASDLEKWLVGFTFAGLALLVASVLLFGKYSPGNFEPLTPTGFPGVIQAASLAFFAYSGFNTIATLTPDVEDGPRTVPRAIISSLGISTLLYLLVVFAMLFALKWNEYGTASNPLSLALSAIKAPAPVSAIVGVAALTATLTVTLSLIIAGSRTTKQMGEDKVLPSLLARGSKVPTAVIAVVMLASLSLGNVEAIALVANFGIILSYMLSGAEVMVARRRGIKGAYLSRGYPYIQIISIALSGLMVASLGEESLAIGGATVLAGLLVYVLYRRRESRVARSIM